MKNSSRTFSRFTDEIVPAKTEIFAEASYMWNKVFKNGPNEICERKPYQQTISLQIFKVCLPQTSPGPF